MTDIERGRHKNLARINDIYHDYRELNRVLSDREVVEVSFDRFAVRFHPKSPYDVLPANVVLKQWIDSMDKGEKAAYIRHRIRVARRYDGPGGP